MSSRDKYYDDLILAAKDAAILISEVTAVLRTQNKTLETPPTLRRLMDAILKAEANR